MTEPQQQVQKKKGLGPIAWVLIGCAGIVLIVVVALGALTFWAGKKIKEFAENPGQAIELIARANPDLDVDRNADGTLTVTDKRNGQDFTFDPSQLTVEEVADGKFEIETSEGTLKVDVNAPDGKVLRIESKDGKEYAVDASAAAEGKLSIEGPDGQTATYGAASADEIEGWVPQIGMQGGAFRMETAEGVTGGFAVAGSSTPEELVNAYREALEAAGFEIQNVTSGSGSAYLQASKDGGARTVVVTAAGAAGQVTGGLRYTEAK